MRLLVQILARALHVGSYLPMPGGLECRIMTNLYPLFPPPVNYLSQYDLFC